MKKIQKFVLNENAEILDKDEMKLLLGGGAYFCYCYHPNDKIYYMVVTANSAYRASYAVYHHAVCEGDDTYSVCSNESISG